MPIVLSKPVSVVVKNRNEIAIVFVIPDEHSDMIIVYNIISNEYTVLHDDDMDNGDLNKRNNSANKPAIEKKDTERGREKNSKSIDVKAHEHSVFKINILTNESKEKEEKYISCDDNHFAVYTHGKYSRSFKRLQMKINEGNNNGQLIEENAIRAPLRNRNGVSLFVCL